MSDNKDQKDQNEEVKPDLNQKVESTQATPTPVLNDAANLDLNETPETSPRTGVNPAVTSAQDYAGKQQDPKDVEPKDKVGYMRPGDEHVYVETSVGGTEVKAAPTDEVPHSIKELSNDEFDKQFTIVGE